MALSGFSTRSPKAYGIAALFLGLPFLVLGSYLLADNLRFARGAASAEALVLENVLRVDAEGQGGYAPRYRFLDAEGRPHVALAPLQSSRPLYRPGERLPVLYPPGRPELSRIGDFFSLYGLGSILAALGLAASGIGAFLWIRHRSEPVVWERGGLLPGLGSHAPLRPPPSPEGGNPAAFFEAAGPSGAERPGDDPIPPKEEHS